MQGGSADGSESTSGNPAHFEEEENGTEIGRGDRKNDPGLGFVEENLIEAERGGAEVDLCADFVFTGDAGFGESHGDSAFAAIVGALDEPGFDEGADSILDG